MIAFPPNQNSQRPARSKGRTLLGAGVLAIATTLAAALAPPRTEAAQKAGSLVAQVTCFYFPPLTESPCPTYYNIYDIKVYSDWGALAPFSLSSFTYNFDYDPTLLRFRADRTSLVCELYASVPAHCPNLPPGQGTTPLATTSNTFPVDQTGLTIIEDPSGLPSIRLSYSAPAPVTISGERNFLALAFDLLVPLAPGASVTYSPSLLPAATFATTGFTCTDATGADVNCDSAQPSLSFKIDPVPAPLALGGLPVMVHASRRIRRRIRLSSR